MDTPNIFVFLLFLKEINVLSFTSHASAPFLVSVVSTFMAELLEPLLIDIEPIGLVVVISVFMLHITIVLAHNLELSSCLESQEINGIFPDFLRLTYSQCFLGGGLSDTRLGHVCAAIGCGSLLCVVYAVCADSIDCAYVNLQGVSRIAACLPNAL